MHTNKIYLHYIISSVILLSFAFLLPLTTHAQDSATRAAGADIQVTAQSVQQPTVAAEENAARPIILEFQSPVEARGLLFNIVVINSDGEVVFETKTAQNSVELPLLPPGFYTWRVNTTATGYKPSPAVESNFTVSSRPSISTGMPAPITTNAVEDRNILNRLFDGVKKILGSIATFVQGIIGISPSKVFVDTEAPLSSDLFGQGGYNKIQKIAQSIEEPPTPTFTFNKIRTKIGKYLSPTDGVIISFQNNDASGNYDVPDNNPFGSVLASASGIIPVLQSYSQGDQLSNSYRKSFSSFSVDIPADLQSGEKFWIVFERSGAFTSCTLGDSECSYSLAKQSGDPYPSSVNPSGKGEQLNYIDCTNDNVNNPDWLPAGVDCSTVIAQGIGSTGTIVSPGGIGGEFPGTGGIVVVGGGSSGSVDDVDLQLIGKTPRLIRKKDLTEQEL
ncbi:hypothetical protein COB64_03575 [Candidatus Wolfebacteria bacterium]|nr:MAG: hypothetical protein COB64_03575 [Candidatus Wolfebacteria bacterium]